VQGVPTSHGAMTDSPRNHRPMSAPTLHMSNGDARFKLPQKLYIYT
jgi:hypothetical protein